MKLTVFQSEKGDCLLVTNKNENRHMLVDGGMRASYQKFAAPTLGRLAAQGAKLDLVYVSHIDQDHIAGVLQLLDDEVNWRIHDFQLQNDNPTHPEPESPRPPAVKEIWHNAFHDQIGENSEQIGELLAATSSILSSATDDELCQIANEQRDLATSIPEAIKLSYRISAEQLNIPLNKRFGSKLAFVRMDNNPPAPIALGSLKIFVIGPFEAELDRLRKEWNQWLENNQETLAKLQRKVQATAERLGANDARTLLELRAAQAEELGDRNKVTPPNLASLTLLVVESGKSLLLTGDAHASDILDGLKFHGKLDGNGQIHVNVLKVQHHGSEHNMDEDFASKVTADHYIFCGNGEHENPNLKVLDVIISSRIGNGEFRARSPRATGPFKLWFNSSESASKKAPAKEHMQKVMDLIKQREAESGGRMSSEFLEGETACFELII